MQQPLPEVQVSSRYGAPGRVKEGRNGGAFGLQSGKKSHMKSPNPEKEGPCDLHPSGPCTLGKGYLQRKRRTRQINMVTYYTEGKRKSFILAPFIGKKI